MFSNHVLTVTGQKITIAYYNVSEALVLRTAVG